MQTGQAWRGYLLVSLVIFSLIGLYLVEPIPQNLEYHHFADTRKILGIANFLNVISNLPFLLVGIAGIKYVFAIRENKTAWSWLILFTSILLVTASSSYYHLDPANPTLAWDRLPIATGFMALFVIVLGDYVNPRLEQWLLVPMLLLGILSVVYWHLVDDLRIYAWVQFVSSGLLLVVISTYKPRTLRTRYLVLAFAFYALAKITEHFDAVIFILVQETTSGHTIKHILAAIGTFFLYVTLRCRNVRQS